MVQSKLSMELEKLSFEIRLFESDIEERVLKTMPSIRYIDLLSHISIEVSKKFGKREEELLRELLDENLNKRG